MSKHIENIKNLDKLGLYITSLWLLFFMLIILKADISIIFNNNFTIIELLKINIIPIISFIFLCLGIAYCFYFDHKFKGTAPIQIKVEKIKNVNYEHILFLTTYIIPLLSFDVSNGKYLLLLVVLLISIGIIYIKTNLFYANPTLALLNYRIYKITGSRNVELKKDYYRDIIIITKTKIQTNNEIQLILLSDNIYYGRPI